MKDQIGGPGLIDVAGEGLDGLSVSEAESRIAGGHAVQSAALISRQAVDGAVGRRFELPVDALGRLHGHLEVAALLVAVDVGGHDGDVLVAAHADEGALRHERYADVARRVRHLHAPSRLVEKYLKFHINY